MGDYQKIHRIGVLSAIGTTLTSLNPAVQDISSWRIDDLVSATLKKYMSSKFTLVDVPFDRNALVTINRQLWRERDTLAFMKTLPNQDLDAYIVVRPADGGLPGPAAIGLNLSPAGTVLWTNFEIDIIDAHSLTYIGEGYARIQTQVGQDPLFAARELVQIPIYRLASGLTPAELDFVHHEVADLLPRALVETVRALDMGVSLPPIGDHSIAAPALTTVMTGLKSVGVIAAIGDSLDLVNPGNLFTKQTRTSVQLPQSGIDDAAESVARDTLSHHYIVRSVTGDRSQLAQMTIIPGAPIPRILGLKPTNDVDAYVLILKANKTGSPYRGLGIWHVTPLTNVTTAVFAQYGIVVLDAHTLRPVTGSTAAEPPAQICLKPDTFQNPMSECVVDNSLWPAAGDGLSADATKQTHDLVLKMLAGEIPETLFQLGLDNSGAPAPAPPAAGIRKVLPRASAT